MRIRVFLCVYVCNLYHNKRFYARAVVGVYGREHDDGTCKARVTFRVMIGKIKLATAFNSTTPS
jgi:hypothetical protein